MKLEEKVMYRVYFGVVTAVVTVAAHKLITAGWKAATGDEPPEATDPDVPATTAFMWALASGVGVGFAQLVATRQVQRRWQQLGEKPKPSKTTVTI